MSNLYMHAGFNYSRTIISCTKLDSRYFNYQNLILYQFNSFLDWKSKLDDIENEATSSTNTPPNWREIFDYDELTETNKDSSLWNEIHRPWWSPQINTNDPPKPSSE